MILLRVLIIKSSKDLVTIASLSMTVPTVQNHIQTRPYGPSLLMFLDQYPRMVGFQLRLIQHILKCWHLSKPNRAGAVDTIWFSKHLGHAQSTASPNRTPPAGSRPVSQVISLPGFFPLAFNIGPGLMPACQAVRCEVFCVRCICLASLAAWSKESKMV